MQVVALPAASVTVMVTGWAPAARLEPGAGDCDLTMAQLSVADTVDVRSGSTPEQPLLIVVVKLGAQVVMTGAVVSTADTVLVQVELLPWPSTTVNVTV
jgi:hypothetical protein